MLVKKYVASAETLERAHEVLPDLEPTIRWDTTHGRRFHSLAVREIYEFDYTLATIMRHWGANLFSGRYDGPGAYTFKAVVEPCAKRFSHTGFELVIKVRRVVW